MKNHSLLLLVLISFNTFAEADLKIQHSQNSFFNNLKIVCGKSFTGKTIFPDDPNHVFAGKHLIIQVASCTDAEIRIPFKVGEDTSRTWILTKLDNRLLLKHDHRHEDGTPDEITMYGGYANEKGTDLSQSFMADEETKRLVPAGKTNVWTISFDKTQNHLFYYLERNDKPRYKAVFDLEIQSGI